MKIEKYLPKSFQTQLRLEKAIIAIVQKQNANKVMQELKHLPTLLQKQIHLKKIRKQTQQSQFVEVLLCLESEEKEKEILMSELKEYIVKIDVMDVPFNAPNTKEQYFSWSKYWPINFIEQQIYKAIKHSEREISLIEHFLQAEDDLIVFNESKQLFRFKSEKGCEKGTIRHPVMDLLQAWPKTEMFEALPSAYYLTKLRLFCRKQLCGMCAMALVHSRLDRIYFYKTNITDREGQILCCEKLNHRVNIFRVTPKVE